MDLFEYLKDLTDTAKDRIKTPITGSFTISFVLYNWPIFATLIFSSQSIEDRINYVNEISSWDTILVPIMIAIFYVVAIPYIMMWLEKASGNAVDNRMKFQIKQKESKLKSLQKVLEIEVENLEIKSGNRDRETLVTENKTLQSTIDSMNDHLQTIMQNHENSLLSRNEQQMVLEKELENTSLENINLKANVLSLNKITEREAQDYKSALAMRVEQIVNLEMVIENSKIEITKLNANIDEINGEIEISSRNYETLLVIRDEDINKLQVNINSLIEENSLLKDQIISFNIHIENEKQNYDKSITIHNDLLVKLEIDLQDITRERDKLNSSYDNLLADSGLLEIFSKLSNQQASRFFLFYMAYLDTSLAYQNLSQDEINLYKYHDLIKEFYPFENDNKYIEYVPTRLGKMFYQHYNV